MGESFCRACEIRELKNIKDLKYIPPRKKLKHSFRLRRSRRYTYVMMGVSHIGMEEDYLGTCL